MDALKKHGWLVLAGSVFIVLAVGGWVFYPSFKPLILYFGLIFVFGIAYWSVRQRKKLDEALKESHYEKFRRLEGLYHTIPEPVLSANKAAENEFTSQLAVLNQSIEENPWKFNRDDAADLVHNLNLALLQIATVDYLRLNIQTLETEYRQAVGPTAYSAYLAAVTRKDTDPPLSPEESERFLRSEATYVANETRRQQLLRQHVQSTRQGLLGAAFRSWWVNIIPLLAILIAFVICLPWIKTVLAQGDWTADVFIATALLCFSGIAGATGGMMSVIQRVQTSVPENDPLTDLLALSQAETAVFFAPVTGLIFALVLSLFFAGGVLSGSVFPSHPDKDGWFMVLFNPNSLAIWLLWAFVAGFCERLVPDALDNLAKQQSENSATTSPIAARSTSQNQVENGAQGVKDLKPSLDPHPDPIPPDATELTVTGHNLNDTTVFYLDNQQMKVKEFAPTSLRVGLTAAALKDKAKISAKAKNPGGDGGDSNVVMISVNTPGG